MSWLTNLSLPKIRDLVRKPQSPDNLWDKCPSCEQMIFHRDLEAAMNVCTHCGFHMRISPAVRMGTMFDGGDYTTIELPRAPVDPLRFRDRKKYVDRLKENQSKTGERDAMVVAHGTIGSKGAVLRNLQLRFHGWLHGRCCR